MSFDFALDGAPAPGPLARAPRKRAAPTLSSSGCVSQQLAFATSGAPVESRAPAVPRVPIVRAEVAAAGAAVVAGVRDGRRWCDGGWMARVIRNEDADGWAVEMLRDGEAEPALVVPWSMEGDDSEPRPLDSSAFNALVRKASGILQRNALQLQARLHKRLTLNSPGGRWAVTLDVVSDDYEPYALLAAFDESGERIAQERVAPDFTLTAAAAQAWIAGDFRCAGGEVS